MRRFGPVNVMIRQIMMRQQCAKNRNGRRRTTKCSFLPLYVCATFLWRGMAAVLSTSSRHLRCMTLRSPISRLGTASSKPCAPMDVHVFFWLCHIVER